MFWLTLILFVLFVGILSYATIKLFRQKETVRAKAVTNTALFFSLLVLWILVFRLQVPYWTILLAMAAAFISGFWGQYLRMYFRSVTFDRYLHAYGSFAFSLLFFYLLDHFLTMGGSPLFLAVFVFLLGNTLGVIFELLEFSHDVKAKSSAKSQHGLKDTNMDMLFNLFGAIVAAVVIYVTV